MESWPVPLTCFHNITPENQNNNRQQQHQQGTKRSLCVFPAKAGDTKNKEINTKNKKKTKQKT